MNELLLRGLLGEDDEAREMYLTNPFFKHSIDTVIMGAPFLVSTLKEGAKEQERQHASLAYELSKSEATELERLRKELPR